MLSLGYDVAVCVICFVISSVFSRLYCGIMCYLHVLFLSLWSSTLHHPQAVEYIQVALWCCLRAVQWMRAPGLYATVQGSLLSTRIVARWVCAKLISCCGETLAFLTFNVEASTRNLYLGTDLPGLHHLYMDAACSSSPWESGR